MISIAEHVQTAPDYFYHVSLSGNAVTDNVALRLAEVLSETRVRGIDALGLDLVDSTLTDAGFSALWPWLLLGDYFSECAFAWRSVAALASWTTRA